MFQCASYDTKTGWTITKHRKAARALRACKMAVARGCKAQLEHIAHDGTWRVISCYRPE